MSQNLWQKNYSDEFYCGWSLRSADESVYEKPGRAQQVVVGTINDKIRYLVEQIKAKNSRFDNMRVLAVSGSYKYKLFGETFVRGSIYAS